MSAGDKLYESNFPLPAHATRRAAAARRSAKCEGETFHGTEMANKSRDLREALPGFPPLVRLPTSPGLVARVMFVRVQPEIALPILANLNTSRLGSSHDYLLRPAAARAPAQRRLMDGVSHRHGIITSYFISHLVSLQQQQRPRGVGGRVPLLPDALPVKAATHMLQQKIPLQQRGNPPSSASL